MLPGLRYVTTATVTFTIDEQKWVKEQDILCGGFLYIKPDETLTFKIGHIWKQSRLGNKSNKKYKQLFFFQAEWEWKHFC